jgi:di/tricarboxylate transporter
MLGLLVISSLVVVALVYYGVFPASEPITWQLWLRVLFAAIVMNQATYLISPQKKE